METISIKEMHPKQCQVMVGKYRVAYICYGDKKPINWLPRSVSGLTLTEDEKIEVAELVRTEMETRNNDRKTKADRLAEISSPEYLPTKNKTNASFKKGNPGRTHKPQDEGDSSS